jgi:hypothetical protein
MRVRVEHHAAEKIAAGLMTADGATLLSLSILGGA